MELRWRRQLLIPSRPLVQRQVASPRFPSSFSASPFSPSLLHPPPHRLDGIALPLRSHSQDRTGIMSYDHQAPHPHGQETLGQTQPIYQQGPPPQHQYQQHQPQGYPQQMQQPSMQQPMMVAQPGMAANSNPLGKPLDAKGQRAWNHGLCSFTDRCGLCCLSCWCPCLTYSEAATKLEALQMTGQRARNFVPFVFACR